MSGQTCVGCGLETRRSYGSWAHRHPWAEVVFAALARFVEQSDRHRTAALALAVPGTLIGLAAISLYPFVFVPLVVLVGVALVVAVGNEEIRPNPACWREKCPIVRRQA